MMNERSSRVWENIALAGIIVILSITYLLPLNGYLTSFSDNATYALLAKSIAAGRGYRSIWSPGEPPHYHYPFFFPLLLSPVVLLSGMNFLWMKAVVVFFALFAACLTFVFYRGSVGPVWALVTSLLVGLCPRFFWFAHQISPETSYLAFSLLALIFAERYIKEDRWLSGSGFAVGIFATFAYLTHKSGILLLPAFFIYFLAKKTGAFKMRLAKTFIFIAASGLLFFLWSLRDFLHSEELLADTHFVQFLKVDYYGEHLGQAHFLDYLGSMGSGLKFYLRDMAQIVLFDATWPFRLWPSVIGWAEAYLPILLGLVVVGGYIYRLLKGPKAVEIYFFLYVGLLFIWPFHTGRHIIPLVPFIIFYFLWAIKGFLSFVFRRKRRLYSKVLVIFIIIVAWFAMRGFFFYYEREANRKFHMDGLAPAAQEFLEMASFIKEKTPPKSIVMSRKPPHLYIFSDRQGVWFPYTADKERVLGAIYQGKPDYLLADGFSRETDLYLWPVIRENPDLFVPVYQGRYGAVFKVEYSREKKEAR